MKRICGLSVPSGVLNLPFPGGLRYCAMFSSKDRYTADLSRFLAPATMAKPPRYNAYKSGHLTPTDPAGAILTVVADSSLPIKSLFLQFETNDESIWYVTGIMAGTAPQADLSLTSAMIFAGTL